MKNRKVKILETTIIEDNNNSKKKKFSKKTFIFSVLIILLLISLMIIPKNTYKSIINKILAMAGIYTEEIRGIEIESNDYDDPGSFKITRSAKWINTNTVQIKIDVDSIVKTGDNYKDIILILDSSSSMNGEKFENVIAHSKSLVNTLLDDSHNRVALITFNTNSQVLSNFTNNKETILGLLDNITTTGNTNYKSGLLNIDTVMTNYNKQNNTDVVALFLTDGYPNEETPSEIATYTMLKDKYPYLIVHGIQYDMGTDIVNSIKSISDNQFVADKTNLKNVLLEASLAPLVYESFIVEDYINTDYFNVNSTDDITTSIGSATIVEESGEKKVVWNLGDNSFFTGSDKSMTIDLTLNDAIPSNKIFYPTNTKEVITYKLTGEEELTKSSTDTPVLTNKYSVIYDVNNPNGCTLQNVPDSEYQVYSAVSKSTNQISCSGHIFKGWKIDSEDDKDITHINEDLFIMPSHDVTVRAEWGHQTITASMDGTVNTHATLYKVLKDEAENDGLAREYTGSHQDSMNSSLSTEKIYHWYASNDNEGNQVVNKNNVIFGGQCWQMIRTTDTGGVKMIYNGEAENNQCLNTRGTHVGYGGLSSQTLSSNYWYGTDYEYDFINKVFSLSGTTEQTTWNATTGPTLIGKYTCKSATETATCSTLYLIDSYHNATIGYTISLNSSSNYYQLGKMQFNKSNYYPAYVGYKYGDLYEYGYISETYSQIFTKTETLLRSATLSTSYWYADSISYSSALYQLNNPYKVSTSTDFPNLVGKYTMLSTSSGVSSPQVYYIALVSGSTMYYKQFSIGNMLADYQPIVFGDSITDNGNGTYTINNPTSTTLGDWYTDYASYNNKYTCNNSSLSCTNPRYVTATTRTNYTYVDAGDKIMIGKSRIGTTLTDTLLVRKDEFSTSPGNYNNYKYTCNTDNAVCTEDTLRIITGFNTQGYNYAPNYYYGSSVTWDGTNYTLVDPIGMENYNNLNNISTHHYICLNYGEKICSSVGYMYYKQSSSIYYLKIENGVTTISKAMEDMITKNTNDSSLKKGIDAWYSKYMLDYDDYIEDVIYCNDRSISSLGGWDDNGGRIDSKLQFKEYNVTSDLSCTNDTDKFSISNPDAKLDYKVGLMTSPEMNILNQTNIRKIGDSYLLGTPSYFDYYGYIHNVSSNGVFSDSPIARGSDALRPAISLKPGTEYYTGDGSKEYPYIVDMNIE